MTYLKCSWCGWYVKTQKELYYFHNKTWQQLLMSGTKSINQPSYQSKKSPMILYVLPSPCIFSMQHVFESALWARTCSAVLQRRGGLGAGLMTADPPAPLQGKISYQAAAALCPAVWGLCQGFLHKCTGVHQAVGGQRGVVGGRMGELKPPGPSSAPSPALWQDWTSSVKALIKDHFQAPQRGTHFHACCEQMEVGLSWLQPWARARTSFF